MYKFEIVLNKIIYVFFGSSFVKKGNTKQKMFMKAHTLNL